MKIVYDENVDGAKLKERPRHVQLDVIKSILQYRNVKSLMFIVLSKLIHIPAQNKNCCSD